MKPMSLPVRIRLAVERIRGEAHALHRSPAFDHATSEDIETIAIVNDALTDAESELDKEDADNVRAWGLAEIAAQALRRVTIALTGNRRKVAS